MANLDAARLARAINVVTEASARERAAPRAWKGLHRFATGAREFDETAPNTLTEE